MPSSGPWHHEAERLQWTDDPQWTAARIRHLLPPGAGRERAEGEGLAFLPRGHYLVQEFRASALIKWSEFGLHGLYDALTQNTEIKPKSHVITQHLHILSKKHCKNISMGVPTPQGRGFCRSGSLLHPSDKDSACPAVPQTD